MAAIDVVVDDHVDVDHHVVLRRAWTRLSNFALLRRAGRRHTHTNEPLDTRPC
jgi:hypothetical protein